MEMLITSAECLGEKAIVKSPQKALMYDVALLTTDKTTMHNVLSRLDALVTWSRMCFKAKKTMPTVKEEPVKRLGRWYEGTLTDRAEWSL